MAELRPDLEALPYLRRFRLNQRVLVECNPDGAAVFRTGTVVRLRRADDGAWIACDTRSQEAVHPFPADDPHGRGTHVLAFPENCKELPDD